MTALLALIVSHNTDTDFFHQNKAIKNTFGLDDFGVSVFFTSSTFLVIGYKYVLTVNLKIGGLAPCISIGTNL